MRKGTVLSLVTLLALLSGARPLPAATYVVEPFMVTQPVYSGMTFYVFRPHNLAPGWHVTFDGYPVIRSAEGLWVYGSYDGRQLVQTPYVVGSIQPQAAPLTPVFSVAEISGMQQIPVRPVTAPSFQPQPAAAVQLATPTYVPSWMVDANFMAIGTWGGLVDRMGMLEKPRLPIAWKGKHPLAVFVWTGRSWYKIQSPNEDLRLTPPQMVRRQLYSLTRMTKANHFRWQDQDTAVLANQAAVWGYLWMGRLTPLAP